MFIQKENTIHESGNLAEVQMSEEVGDGGGGEWEVRRRGCLHKKKLKGLSVQNFLPSCLPPVASSPRAPTRRIV